MKSLHLISRLILGLFLLLFISNGLAAQDQLEEEMRKLLSGLPLVPHFIDARQYHKWGGEVHCATNVRREGFRTPWWTMK